MVLDFDVQHLSSGSSLSTIKMICLFPVYSGILLDRHLKEEVL